MSQFEELIVGKLVITGGGSIGTLANVAGLTVKHFQMGALIKSVFTLDNVQQSISNEASPCRATKIFNFPVGYIKLQGGCATLSQKTTSAIASTITSGAAGSFSVGTSATVNNLLAGAEINVLEAAVFASSTVIDVAGTPVSWIASTANSIGGKDVTESLYLNCAYTDETEVDAAGTQTISGTIVILWLNVGNY